MRTITLEEHYATPVFMDGPGRQNKPKQSGRTRRRRLVLTGSSTSSATLARAGSRTWTPLVSTSRSCH